MKNLRKFFGLAQRLLCLVLCVSLLGTSGFGGVAHANPTGQVMDLNGGPYSSITGNNMDGVCLLDITQTGQLRLNKNCRITATGSNSSTMAGVRIINSSPNDPLYAVVFTNSAIISSHNAGGDATGFGMQNVGVSTWGNALTIDGVKSEKNNGNAIGFSSGNPAATGTNTLFTTAPVQSGSQELTGKGANLTIQNIESTKGSAAGIFANPKITIKTNGGDIIVKNVSAKGTGEATANDIGAVGVNLNKESTIATNRGNLTITNVSSSFDGKSISGGFYGSARGLALYNGATLELMEQGDTKSGVLTIDGVTATGANSIAIGYDIHNANDYHQGPVIIRNIKATGAGGKSAAICVTADNSQESAVYLGYKGAEHNILTGATYRIEGDLVAAHAESSVANLGVALQNKNSFLKGNLLTTDPTGLHTIAGIINLNVLNGGTWYPVFDASNSATAETNTTVKLSEGGFIDLAYTGLDTNGSLPIASYGDRTSRTLTLNKLEANGGSIIVNTDINNNTADKIVLTSVTDSDSKGIKVLVAHDPIMNAIKIPSATKIDLATPIEIVQVDSGNLSKVEGAKFKVSQGAHSYETKATFEKDGNNWKMNSLSFALLGLSPTAIATRIVTKAIGTAFLATTNTLQKRLGDLRNGAGSNIGWVRFTRTNNYMDDLKLNGNQYQIGYDRQITSDDVSKRYLGVAIDQYDGTNSFESGDSDVKSTTLGVYYTRMFESGHFYDFIFRYGRIYGDWTSFDSSLPEPITKADYGVNSVSLSAEYGYRWNIGKVGFYIEPQVELTAGYVSSGSDRTNKGELVYMDSARHFITRGGIAFGQRSKNFNYYLRFSYNHDFAGDLNVDYAGERIKTESAKNWLDATLGLGWLMKDNCYLYGEVSKLYKDITNSLNFNVGFRITL